MTIFEKTIKDNARFSSLRYKKHIKFSMDDVHSNGSNSRVSQICWNPLIAVASAFHVNKLYASSAVSWSSKDEACVLKGVSPSSPSTFTPNSISWHLYKSCINIKQPYFHIASEFSSKALLFSKQFLASPNQSFLYRAELFTYLYKKKSKNK